MQTEFAFVGIVILGVLGFSVDRIFLVTTNRLLARYLPRRAR
jgi:ABC-type nitrate/sulfonate/bicarbonate transport system permease component